MLNAQSTAKVISGREEEEEEEEETMRTNMSEREITDLVAQEADPVIAPSQPLAGDPCVPQVGLGLAEPATSLPGLRVGAGAEAAVMEASVVLVLKPSVMAVRPPLATRRTVVPSSPAAP